MKKYTVLLLASLLTANVYPQPDTGRNIFVEDFDYFIGKLCETHPDPYTAYGGQVGFLREKTLRREALKMVDDTLLFVRQVREFLSPLRDGHTYVALEKAAEGSARYLPVQMWIAMDGILVRDSDPADSLPIGSMITAVDGVPIEELSARMSLLRAAENRYHNYLNLANEIATDRDISGLLGYLPDTVTVTALYQGRTVTRPLAYRETRPARTNTGMFDAESPNGILYTRMLPGAGYFRWNSILSRELIETNRNLGYDTGFLLTWAFSYLDGEPSGDFEQDIARVPYLYSTFADLLDEMDRNGVENIIIDLRTNGGGMTPLTYTLVRMLYGDGFLTRRFDAMYGVRLSPLLLEKRGYGGIADWNERRGRDYLTGDMSMDDFVPNGRRPLEELERMDMFNGLAGEGTQGIPFSRSPGPYKVYVLVSPLTFSAAFHLTYMLSEMGAELIGVTPAQAGNTFMEQTAFRLPGTGLRASVSNSVQLLYPDDPQKGRELTPDHAMYQEDFHRYSTSADAEILRTLELIREREAAGREGAATGDPVNDGITDNPTGKNMQATDAGRRRQGP